jgi:hypothetical protein
MYFSNKIVFGDLDAVFYHSYSDHPWTVPCLADLQPGLGDTAIDPPGG